MLLQPGNHGLGLPIREEIDDTVPLEINQNRAIPMPAAEGEVIDTQDPWHGSAIDRGGPDGAQDRIRASPHPQPHQESCARFAPHDEADQFQGLGTARSPPRVRSNDTGESLGEDAALAGVGAAPEASHRQAQTNRDV
jgi:hypothetical protein